MAGSYMAAASQKGGSAVGTPDTCNVPNSSGVDTPTPFTNTGQNSSATGTASTVLIENMPAITISSSIPSSSGDESGTDMGVTSGSVAGKVTYSQGSSKVLVKGNALVVLTNATGHNGSSPNAVGTVSSPGGTKVMAAL